MSIIISHGVAEWDLNNINNDILYKYIIKANIDGTISILYCTDVIYTEILKEHLMILMTIEKPYIVERRYVTYPTFCVICETYNTNKIVNVYNVNYNSSYYKTLTWEYDDIHICDRCYMKQHCIKKGHIIIQFHHYMDHAKS